MKKTVFFDLGNVLIFFSHKKMCRQVADIFGVSPEIIYDILFKERIADDYENGFLSSEELYHLLCRTLKKEPSFLELFQAASNIFEPNNAIFPIVDRLKKENVHLVLLSNTCEAHFNFAYSHFQILKEFDDFLLSYELKVKKPDPRIFQKALSLASISTSFYTDDLKENIQSAKKVGLDGERYIDSSSLEHHLKSRCFLYTP